MTTEDIRAIIFAKRLPARKEGQMQAAIAERLAAAGAEYRREVILPERAGRIDFEVTTDEGLLGIECKTQGSAMAATRQLIRYADTGRYRRLVLLSVFPLNIPLATVGTGSTPVTLWQIPSL